MIYAWTGLTIATCVRTILARDDNEVSKWYLRLSAGRKNRSSLFQSEQQRRKALRANDIKEIVKHSGLMPSSSGRGRSICTTDRKCWRRSNENANSSLNSNNFHASINELINEVTTFSNKDQIIKMWTRLCITPLTIFSVDSS